MSTEKSFTGSEQPTSGLWRTIYKVIEGLYAREKRIIYVLHVVNALCAFIIVYLYCTLQPLATGYTPKAEPAWAPEWARFGGIGQFVGAALALVLNISGGTMRLIGDDTMYQASPVARFGRCLETTGPLLGSSIHLMANIIIRLGFDNYDTMFWQSLTFFGIFFGAFGTLSAYYMWHGMLSFAGWWKRRTAKPRTIHYPGQVPQSGGFH